MAGKSSGSGAERRRGARGRRPGRIFHPVPVVIAVVLLYAAAHEPDDFSLESLLVWGLTSLMIGLLACAAVVIAEPILRIFAMIFVRPAPRPSGKAEES